MRKALSAAILFLACGLNHKENKEQPSFPAGAIASAWSEAERSSPDILKDAVRGDSALYTLYEKRGWRPLLFSSPYLNDYGRLILAVIENREFDGLRPDPCADSALVAMARAESLRLSAARLADHEEMIPVYRASLRELARAEVFLVRAWERWAEDMGGDSEALRRFFEDPVSASVELEPPFGEYRVLRATLAAYSALPDWKPLSFRLEKGQKIVPGDTGPRVCEIQERLKAEGFYTGPINGIYDSATFGAVKAFQKWHYLDEDGIVGWGTVKEMNVPRAELMARLREGLVYWRTTPLRAALRCSGWVFRINIPEFILYVYKDGRLIQKNKVAVGAADRDTNYTPTLRDTIEFIVINPKWNVPDRIFEEELLEEIYESGDAFKYLEEKKLRVASKKGKVWLVRDPGEGNALGRVKFLFPNRYNIYLHDTPIKSTFALKTRAVSHGCIRLDGAIQLAIDVLTQTEGWTEKQFYEALEKTEEEGGKTVYKETWVPLRHKIPIFIDYVLVAAEPGAERAVFLRDIYNRSAKGLWKGSLN